MALYRNIVEESAPDENGWIHVRIVGEEEARCVVCGGEAHPNVCPVDGRYHHHGCVHSLNHAGPIPVCSVARHMAELGGDRLTYPPAQGGMI